MLPSPENSAQNEQLQLSVEIHTLPTEVLKLISCEKVQRQTLLHTGAFFLPPGGRTINIHVHQ